MHSRSRHNRVKVRQTGKTVDECTQKIGGKLYTIGGTGRVHLCYSSLADREVEASLYRKSVEPISFKIGYNGTDKANQTGGQDVAGNPSAASSRDVGKKKAHAPLIL